MDHSSLEQSFSSEDLIQVPSVLHPLATRFCELLDLTTVPQKNALTTVLTRGLTESLAGTNLLKPNAISFALRSLQLDNTIPLVPAELKKHLTNAITGLVDAGNIKTINEDPDGSYAAGDAAIKLHIESVSGAALEMGMIPVIFRPSGDEFLPLLLTNNPIELSLFKEKINEYTQEALNKIRNNPDHPLYKIVTHLEKSKLITKSISFGLLQNVRIPDKEMRMADLSEIILAQAEAGSEGTADLSESIFKTSLKKFIKSGFFPKHIFDTSYAQDAHAVDSIIADMEQTTSVTADELDPDKIAKRWQIIDTYCPPSLIPSVQTLRKSSTGDAQKEAHSLTLIEEALFNLKYQREPPILNRWVYQELVSAAKNPDGSFRYTEAGMISTYFLKLINMVDGRLGGNQVLHSVIDLIEKCAISQAKANDFILTKDGGSLYFAAAKNKADQFIHNLDWESETNIHSLQDELAQDSGNYPENIAKTIRHWTQIPTYYLVTIPDTEATTRSPEFMGALFDQVRNTQYYRESAQADYLALEMNRSIRGHSSITSTIFMALFWERALRRISDWAELWHQPYAKPHRPRFEN